jgi:hypothetical protein
MRTDFSKTVWMNFPNQRDETVEPIYQGLPHWHKVSNIFGNTIETIFSES